MTVNKCAICQAVFGSWPEFNMHHKDTHNIFGVRPERTSNRTKQEIVKDFETRHPKLFFVIEKQLTNLQDSLKEFAPGAWF